MGAGLQPFADPVRGTAWLAVFLWAAACGALLTRRSVARALWPLAWAACAVHVAVAFEWVHGWSHAAAFEDTRQKGGVGEGVFVNYAVLAVWCVDAMWLAGWPKGYARRPRWVGWAVHGFLAFVIFNAAVVFADGVSCWVGVGVFVALGWVAVRPSAGRG